MELDGAVGMDGVDLVCRDLEGLGVVGKGLVGSLHDALHAIGRSIDTRLYILTGIGCLAFHHE